MNTKPLAVLIEGIEALREYTSNPEIPAQHMLTFLHISLASEMPMADLMKRIGTSQASVSRNVRELSQGAPHKPGAGLVEAYEDPYFRARKLVRLTAKGRRLCEEIEQRTAKYCDQGYSKSKES
jgi:DNA-binding MarR family transcriptional regulator